VNHLLDGVDYRMMGKTPKIFTGVSDGTTLLNTIFAKRVLQHIIAQIPCGCLVEELEPFRGDFVKTLFNSDVGQLLKKGCGGLIERVKPAGDSWVKTRNSSMPDSGLTSL